MKRIQTTTFALLMLCLVFILSSCMFLLNDEVANGKAEKTLNGADTTNKIEDLSPRETPDGLILKGGTITGVTDEFKQNCTDYSIPSSFDGTTITEISSLAFFGCTKLKNLTIPNSVTKIRKGALSGCSALESISIPFIGSNPKDSSNCFGYIFGTDEYPGADYTYNGSGRYYIPSSLKNVTVTGGELFSESFSNCDKLESIVLPENITSIGSYSFADCDRLTSVTIYDKVTIIGDDAFYQCGLLTDIYYQGTKAQWEAIQNQERWSVSLFNRRMIVHCSDGTIRSAYAPQEEN